MASIVMIRSGIVHPSLVAQVAARGALTRGIESLGVTLDVHTVRGGAAALADVAVRRPWAIALMMHHPGVDDRAVRELCAYVDGGGRLLALHGVTASFKGSPRFGALLGRRFEGHGPVRPMTLRRVPDVPASPSDLPERVTLVDEPYAHASVSDVTPWFSGDDDEPHVWTREHGRGRVAVFVPGHRSSTYHEPEVARILGALVGWLSRGGTT